MLLLKSRRLRRSLKANRETHQQNMRKTKRKIANIVAIITKCKYVHISETQIIRTIRESASTSNWSNEISKTEVLSWVREWDLDWLWNGLLSLEHTSEFCLEMATTRPVLFWRAMQTTKQHYTPLQKNVYQHKKLSEMHWCVILQFIPLLSLLKYSYV